MCKTWTKIGFGDLEKSGGQKCVSLNVRKKRVVLSTANEQIILERSVDQELDFDHFEMMV